MTRRRHSGISAACPICTGGNNSFVGKPFIESAVAPFVRKDYDILECRDCRFYFVNPAIDLTPAEWAGVYGDEYFTKMTSAHERSRRRDRQQRLGWLREAFDGIIGNFLDIGCGEGYVLIDAHHLGWRTVGIDIADGRIPQAHIEGIEYISGDLFEVAFPDSSFDAIYMDSVLEHVAEPVRMVGEIRRILRPGGVLYLGVPNEDSLLNDARKALYILTGRRSLSTRIKPFKRPYHVIGFTEKSLKSIFRNNGFEFVRFRNFAGPWEWVKARPFTRLFVMHFAMIPAYLLAAPLRKMIYFEAIVKKT
jgi:SAM-dependent methyltransferase